MNANLRNFTIWAIGAVLILALFTAFHPSQGWIDANLRNLPFWVTVVLVLVALFLVFLDKWRMNANLRKFALSVLSFLLLLALLLVFLSPGLFLNVDQRSVSQDISFSQMLSDVDQGKVREVIIQGQEIRGAYRDGRGFYTYAPNDPTFVQRLYSKGIVIIARPLQDNVPWFVSLLVSWLPFIALIGVWIFLSRASGFGKRGTMSETLLDNPKHWRDRAVRARTVAEQLADPESKRRLLEIADGYEYLAQRAEERFGDAEKSK